MFTLKVDENITLRILETQDAEELFSLVDANREHLRKWFPWVDKTKSAEDSRAFISSTLKGLADGNEIHCGIQYKNELAGIIGTLPINHNARSVEIGYWLGEKFQGKGLVSLSGKVFLSHLFDKLDMNRVVIKYFIGNDRSAKTAKNLGFTYEGALREANCLYGKPVDVACTSLLRSEWELTRTNQKNSPLS